jgi:hypothetical protein
MTCIVAIEQGDSVWMGGDAIAIDDSEDKCLLASPKVFARGSVLIGSTGDIRASQILRHRLVIPAHSTRTDDEEWVCTSFVDAVREAFRSGGATTQKDGAEVGHKFLLGYRGKVYQVENAFSAFRITRGFDAVGCGAKYAVGALVAASTRIKQSPRQRVEMALEAAEACNAGVARPFTIIHGAKSAR